jgi:hypothetical protein
LEKRVLGTTNEELSVIGVGALALRFTLSRQVTSAVSPGNEEQLWWMCDTANRLTPLSPEEEARLRSRAEGRPIFPH